MFECPDDFPAASEPTREPTHDVVLNEICRNNRRKVKLGAACEAGRFVALGYGGGPSRSIYDPPNDAGVTTVGLYRLLINAGGNVACDKLPEGLTSGPVGTRLCEDDWNVQLTPLTN